MARLERALPRQTHHLNLESDGRKYNCYKLKLILIGSAGRPASLLARVGAAWEAAAEEARQLNN